MIEIIKIEDFSMKYFTKNDSECYEYIQVEDSLVLSPDKQTIRATLKNKKHNEDIDPFDIVITKKDGRYSIKSDFFEDASALYPLTIFEGDNEFILAAEFPAEAETMYLHAYYG